MMEGSIKFFGTGGARFVALKQLRATGGMWLNYRKTNLYIDPGPGAIVRIRSSKEPYEPSLLDGIVITHKHMDHANDVNILIESMTEGGFKKRGTLFCPEDALATDPVVFNFARKYLDRVVFLREGGEYTLGDIHFRTPVRHKHPVETYGLLFQLNKTIGLIADTRFFPGLAAHYRAQHLIINVLRLKPIENHEIIEHLALKDVRAIIEEVRPETAILTHFGMHIINEGPSLLAKKLAKETGVKVIAGRDGMKWEF
ncbi:MAG: MBL fold metallo-hydrolase [Syntrophorhabdaceae bacterium]|nr:MBL fold metallo-hydrolase [Syntrophorhabdaceae bacterium]